jgi:hypothetical protein
MLKIKDIVDLKELEKFGFVRDACYQDEYGDAMYSYEFLLISPNIRDLCICTGYDELFGDKEIIKLYDLIQAGLVEKVGE